MEIANKLFIASISGDKKAQIYLKEFKHKFGILDRAFKEEYDNLVSMLALWDNQK